MKHLLLAVSVVACGVGSTAALARGPSGVPSMNQFRTQQSTSFPQPLPQMPASSIPAPLAAPAQAPAINGPVSQPHGPTNVQ
jgi:hypothetical protein